MSAFCLSLWYNNFVFQIPITCNCHMNTSYMSELEMYIIFHNILHISTDAI